MLNRLKLRWLAGFGYFAVMASGCTAPAHFDGVHPARATVESSVTTTSAGTVEARQEAVLGFDTAGRVASVDVAVGDVVKPGQILATLDTATELEASLHKATAAWHRAQKLGPSGLISRSNFDEAKANYELAKANLAKAEVRAPFAGIMTEVNLKQGEVWQSSASAQPGKEPLYIVDLAPRIIKAEIDEIDLAKVRVGMQAHVTVLAYGPKPLQAVVSKVVPFVSTSREQDRTAPIELTMAQETQRPIPIGASADIEIITAVHHDVLAVPSRAVFGTGKERYVYLAKDQRAKKENVSLGLYNYDRSEITSGLTSEAIVLLPSEKQEIKPGMKVQVELQPWPGVAP